MDKSSRLRQLIQPGRALVMPDAYDAASARIIEKLGFQAVQCSGFSMAIAAFCCAETKLGLDENVRLTGQIAAAVSAPVMADGEDGFGDASAIGQTVRRFIDAGAAGLNLEDQVLQPGHTAASVVDRQAMVEKIAAARRAAVESGHAACYINGRTDALATAQDKAAGLSEAIERSNLYLGAGADLAFVTGVSTAEQARRLVREVAGPVSIAAGMPYNMSLTIAELQQCGVARVSLPTLAILASTKAITQALADMAAGVSFTRIAEQGRLSTMAEVGALLS